MVRGFPFSLSPCFHDPLCLLPLHNLPTLTIADTPTLPCVLCPHDLNLPYPTSSHLKFFSSCLLKAFWPVNTCLVHAISLTFFTDQTVYSYCSISLSFVGGGLLRAHLLCKEVGPLAVSLSTASFGFCGLKSLRKLGCQHLISVCNVLRFLSCYRFFSGLRPPNSPGACSLHASEALIRLIEFGWYFCDML